MVRFRVTKTSLQPDFKFSVNVAGKIQFSLRNECFPTLLITISPNKDLLMTKHRNYLHSTEKDVTQLHSHHVGVPLNTLRGKESLTPTGHGTFAVTPKFSKYQLGIHGDKSVLPLKASKKRLVLNK